MSAIEFACMLVLTTLLMPLTVQWVTEQAPFLARRITCGAARILPPADRDRYRDEWIAELEEMERQSISQLAASVRILLSAPSMRLALRAGRDAQHGTEMLPWWFSTYTCLEESAIRVRAYEPLFVPALLQTPQYAAAVLALGDLPAREREQQAALRRERQRRFIEGQLRLWVIIDESALRRRVGAADILRDQLQYLLQLSARHNLTLQITPLGAGGHAALGAFTILRFSEPELPDMVYVEQVAGTRYIDEREQVDRYMLSMERLSIISAKPAQTRGILATIINQLEEPAG
jgi:Domain of unknown function (DUF5753)